MSTSVYTGLNRSLSAQRLSERTVEWPGLATDHMIPSSSGQLEPISLWYRLGSSVDCFSQQLFIRCIPRIFDDVIIKDGDGGRLNHLRGGRRTVKSY
jgi:hypothetical protein